MSRKSRDGQEDRGRQVPPSGPEVFKPQRNPHALIKVKPLPGQEDFIRVRWPAATARAQSGVELAIPREIIRMDERQKVSVTYPDPYLDAEAAAAARKGAA